MKRIQTATIAAPGFLGLNTQESSIQLSSGYALKAQNCVIDRYGRIGARRGWTTVNSAVNTDLGAANPVEFIFEMIDVGGNQTISAGNNKLFTGTTTMTTKTVRTQANTADVSYTITGNNWQATALPYGDGSAAVSHAYMVQTGHPVLVFHNLPTPGTGATFSVTTVSSGAITAVSVTAAGSGYGVGDILTMSGGSGSGAKLTVATLSGTGVATVTISTPGTGYTAGNSLTSTVTTIANPHSHSGSFGFQQLGDIGTLPTGYSIADFKPNCALAAYGRIWMADLVGDRQTVYFSRLLDGSDFQGGDSGSLSINSVFPNNDQIIALAAHNGFLIIFGRNNIAIYSNPIDVTSLALADFIPNVGCIARDSVQNTGTDIVFLSDSGVRSLQRVIQEKSLPMRDMSKNVRDDLIAAVASETASTIKSVYYDRDAFYLLTLPATKVTYCFDMRGALQDGSARVTIWDSLDPKALFVNQSKELLLGKPGYIGKYFGHLDNASTYRLQYYTNYFDFGSPTALKVLKKIGFVVIGGSGDAVAIKWGFDYKENYNSETKLLDTGVVYEYNIGEYNIAEFSNGVVLDQFQINAGGNGAVMQLGLEAELNGDPLSIQKIDVYVAQGKTV
ncbi:hypothetical protein UFOVP837_21 [uncultured Caudovirales phage]|uniref:Uncharacterized protein n=1 Tax=uncultured Caudovirales phage TaxID=2100421 RepID=A0A6J5PAC4_9CAUD|nr:hypothetical protein UFOVP837_21 [uncultured Caudovirales phage]